MSLTHFQALVQQLGARLGAPDMHTDDSGYLALTIDSVEAHFQYEPDDGIVVLFTRLQEVEIERAAEIYGLLLAANLFWQGTNGATFSIDFDTGKVFLADRRRAEGLSEQELEDWLEGFVNIAIHWQQRLETANAGGALFPDESPAANGAADHDGFPGVRV
ncbi:type III secretion system chaperone [Bordetella sp. BOR01]|uniref:type III secretion system chaperone n=1 Tax=Bordetella sp. BOR01 TaxID=2854779 RepID=UPI001C441ECD|nr:type III secretion system chaperone [Bordetella sp. BOR01]MBV7486820.1 type III secretion system chaperone [Bordetella sp. BOR01]